MAVVVVGGGADTKDECLKSFKVFCLQERKKNKKNQQSSWVWSMNKHIGRILLPLVTGYGECGLQPLMVVFKTC